MAHLRATIAERELGEHGAELIDLQEAITQAEHSAQEALAGDELAPVADMVAASARVTELLAPLGIVDALVASDDE
jgi:hypothetical protein